MKNYVAEILFDNHEKWKEHKYIFEKENGAFRPHTYGEFYEDVLNAASLPFSLRWMWMLFYIIRQKKKFSLHWSLEIRKFITKRMEYADIQASAYICKDRAFLFVITIKLSLKQNK